MPEPGQNVSVHQTQTAGPTHVSVPKGVAWFAVGTFVIIILVSAGSMALCGVIIAQQRVQYEAIIEQLKAHYTAAWVREADKFQEAADGRKALSDDVSLSLEAVRVLRAELIAAGAISPPADLTMRWPPRPLHGPDRDSRKADRRQGAGVDDEQGAGGN